MSAFGYTGPCSLLSLAILEQALGPNHEHTATTVEGLGVLYQRMAEYKRAEPLLEHCLAINERTKGPEHPSTGLALDSLGNLYRVIGRFDGKG
jgi:tetratricopeptide (TPR) repeat protein